LFVIKNKGHDNKKAEVVMKEKNNSDYLLEISSTENILNIEGLKEFPFKTALSFKYLIEFWDKEAKNENKLKASYAQSLINEVSKYPELKEPITDASLIEKHRDLIDLLLTVVYPPAQWEKTISASYFPFQFRYFYVTPKYREVFYTEGSLGEISFNTSVDTMLYGKTLNAYMEIFYRHYNEKLKAQSPVVAKILDKRTGLFKYFRIIIDTSFVRSVAVEEIPVISDEDRKKLLNDPLNLNLWMKLIPPNKFEFHGFVTFTAVSINDSEILSLLKNDLLEKEVIFSPERFQSIEEKLRSLFNIPQLKLGLAAVPKDWSLLAECGRKIGSSFILNDSCTTECCSIKNSIYDRAKLEGKPLIVEDVEKYEMKTEVESKILEQGIRNILIAPLYYQNEPIGVLELGSPNPGDITPLNSIKVKEVLSLFAIAVKRSMEEFENNVQKIIKENCTAIHPTVEWRFRRAAVNLLLKKDNERLPEMEPIVFDNVYPLYALTDIRDSSENRNRAIQSDLVEHLNYAKEILSAAHSFKPLPLFNEMNFRISKYNKKIKLSLNSADEINITEFLQNEVEPILRHVKEYDPSLKEMIKDYHKALDPNLRVFYSKRSDYEKSVNMINETISNYLDEAEIESQKMFPHYFEKYKTDGIEHNIYIGASIVEDRKFDQLYLRNLRLWQFMVVCGIAGKSEELKKKMKIPLETSHLILVQNNPLSIRFRFDEKKFDVDGTYNLRYEIMKKRIDKALIKGTKERLTQPGKIAIIFSQPKEANEYKRYIEYLEGNGYLDGKAEELDVEDLQGVYGLKALRVKVNFSTKPIEKIKREEISKTVEQFANLVN